MNLKHILNYKWILRSLPKTLYFNFHYLPLKQAIKLPILLYKPKFVKLGGGVSISGPISFGMIQMGRQLANVYPNDGVTWENRGNVKLRGSILIGSHSFISVGRNGCLDIGDNFRCLAALKIVCFKNITFNRFVRLGWECTVLDTNFHPLYDIEKKTFKSASGPISIGEYNWFGMGCKIMHSVSTPERCIFGMGSIVTRGSEMESYCVMANMPRCRIISRNVLRDIGGPNDLEK